MNNLNIFSLIMFLNKILNMLFSIFFYLGFLKENIYYIYNFIQV